MSANQITNAPLSGSDYRSAASSIRLYSFDIKQNSLFSSKCGRSEIFSAIAGQDELTLPVARKVKVNKIEPDKLGLDLIDGPPAKVGPTHKDLSAEFATNTDGVECYILHSTTAITQNNQCLLTASSPARAVIEPSS